MAEDIMRRLKKKIIFDPEIGLDRLCWVLDTFCPLCGQPLEVIFDEKQRMTSWQRRFFVIFLKTTIPNIIVKFFQI